MKVQQFRTIYFDDLPGRISDAADSLADAMDIFPSRDGRSYLTIGDVDSMLDNMESMGEANDEDTSDDLRMLKKWMTNNGISLILFG